MGFRVLGLRVMKIRDLNMGVYKNKGPGSRILLYNHDPKKVRPISYPNCTVGCSYNKDSNGALEGRFRVLLIEALGVLGGCFRAIFRWGFVKGVYGCLGLRLVLGILGLSGFSVLQYP